MTKINILIVEDNEDHLFFIKKFLPAEQYNLQEIVNGTEAYNYLLNPKIKPDVVLLDNHLPGMSGLEILEELGAKKEAYGFILTTIDSDPDILIKALKNGALDLLLKTPDYLYTLPQKIEKAYKLCQSRLAKKQTEANFRSIIESGDDDIWAIDTNYKLIAFNQSFKQNVIGLTTIPIKIGEDILKIFPKNNIDFWKPKYDCVFKGKKLSFEFRNTNDKLNRHYDIRLNPIFLNGIVTGLSVIGRDITNQKNIENDLFKAQQIANLGSYKLDISSGNWQSSPILDSIFGIDDSFNKNIDGWLNIVHPDDRLMIQDYFMTDAVKNREKIDKEYRIIRIDDKQERWVYGIGELILNDVGEPLQMFGTIQDITESKKAELAKIESKKQLQETNFFLQEAQNITLLGYYIYNFQTKQWKSSEMMSNLMGLKFNEGGLQQWIDIIIPEDKHILTDVLKKRLKQTDYPLDVTYRVKSKGNIHWIHHTAQPPQKDKIGQYLPVMGVLQDITESKKAEEKLKQSEKRFRELYEKSGDAILIIKNGIFIDCNKATIAMLKYKSKAAFLNTHPSKLSPKTQPNGQDSYSEAEKMMQIALKKGTHRFEWLHTKQDGTIFPVEVLLTTISNEPQNVIIHCVWRDIADRKQAEENLKQSEQLYKSVFGSSPLGIFHFNNKSVITDVNKELVRIIGSTHKKIVGLNIYNDFTDNKMIEAVRCTLEKGSGYYEGDYTSATANKTTPLIIRFKAIKDIENKIVGGVGLCEDITERKKIEKALKENEHQLQEAQQIAQLGHFVYDDTTEIYTTSKILDTIVGVDSNYIKNKKGWIDLCHPEDLVAALRVFNSVTNKKASQEFRMIRFNDKKIIWVFVTAKKEFDSSTGQRSKLIGTIQDITERKLSEEKLKQSEQKLKAFQKITNLGTFIFDDSKNVFETESICNAILGIDTTYKRDIQGFINLLHPEDYQEAQDLLDNNAIKTLFKELRIVRPKDKKTIWVLSSVSKEFNDKGIRTKITGTIQDITKRKLAEEKLKQSDIILNKIDSLVLVGGLGGDLHYISPNIEKLLGYKPAELLGQKWWQMTFFDKSEIKKRQDVLDQFILKGVAIKNKFITRKTKTKNGKFKWIEWHISKGVGNTFISIGIDVTEKYRQENINNVIYNITKKANEALPQELFFDFIRLQLSKLIDTTNFFIALGNEESEFLTVPYMIDEKDTKDDFLKKNSLSGYVIDTKNSLLLKDSDKKNLKIIEQGPESKCWLGTPLIIKNKVIGLIAVQSYTDEKAYTIEDVRLLELIANSISQVIKQSQDFEQINLLSHALIQSDEGVIITNIEGDIQYVNPAFTKLSGYTEKEVLGQNPRFLKSGKQVSEYYETLWNTILSGDTWSGEFINKRKDGSQYLVLANISPIKNSKGEITHFVGIEEDITEKRKLERNFLHAFIDAQEVEKQNFGEELHDGVSQILSAQTMFVDVLKTLLKNADAKVLKHLNTVKKLNTQAINETRSIAHGLMSKQLKESGLIVAVEQICNDYNTSRDINFSFGYKGLEEQEINAEIKSNIFRIIQEVSTNTVRHSVAKKAQIKLSKTTHNQLKVVVKDNGIGIDFERMKENKKGAGLENIKRRIQLLNGTIDLKTAPNKGTQYTFIIPLDNIQ